MFLKISQISQENTCVPRPATLLKKETSTQENTCVPRPATLLKKETPTQAFPVKFAKFLRAPIMKNICKRLL